MGDRSKEWGFCQISLAFVVGVTANVVRKLSADWTSSWRNALEVGLHGAVIFGVLVLLAGLRTSLELSGGYGRQRESHPAWLADSLLGSALLGIAIGLVAVSVPLQISWSLDFVPLPLVPDWFRYLELIGAAIAGSVIVWLVARKTDHERVACFVVAHAMTVPAFVSTIDDLDYPEFWSGLNYAFTSLIIAITTAFILRQDVKDSVGSARRALVEVKRETGADRQRRPTPDERRTPPAPPPPEVATGDADSKPDPVADELAGLKRNSARWAMAGILVTIAVALALPQRSRELPHVPDPAPLQILESEPILPKVIPTPTPLTIADPSGKSIAEN